MRIRALVLAIAVSAGALGGLLALTVASAIAASPPVAVTNEATEVKRARATLAGYVLPQPPGENTVYYFEYGTEACRTETCGVKTPTRGPVTEEGSAEPFKLTGLKPGTTYHFWFVASSAGGTAYGEEMTFTTLVAETKEYVLEKGGPELSGFAFESSGPVGVAVNDETGNVYVSTYEEGAPVHPSQIAQYGPSGTFQSSTGMPAGHTLDSLAGVAVDNSAGLSHGDVYVTDETASVVYKFVPDSEGKLSATAATPIGEGTLTGPNGVAVDSAGNVYVTNSGAKTVSKFSLSGTLLAAELVTGLSSPLDLAVDPAGNIYVAGLSNTLEYGPTGACVEAGCAPLDGNEGQGIAVDSAGNIFVADGSAETVLEYGAGAGHPVIPNIALELKANYPRYPRYLAVDDTHQKLYATEHQRAVKIFKFIEIKPVVVKTEPATQVKGPVEELNGKVNPGGLEPAEYYFEYGTSPCLPETCGTVATESSQIPVNGDEEIPVSVRLDNLPPNTTYHYRIVGVNEESGVEYGGEQTFTTGGPVTSPPAPAPEGSAPVSNTPASSPIYPLLTNIVPVPIPKVPPVKKLTRAQLLAKALSACNRRPKRQRAACRQQAHRKYGSVTKGVAKKRKK
jgi:DNA-binding beta-propeller fold protein YncE